jgi:hypothetical protein
LAIAVAVAWLGLLLCDEGTLVDLAYVIGFTLLGLTALWRQACCEWFAEANRNATNDDRIGIGWRNPQTMSAAAVGPIGLS